jgi:hypothetical protein
VSKQKEHFQELVGALVEDVCDTLLFWLWRVREELRPPCRVGLQQVFAVDKFVRAECGNPASFHCPNGYCFGHCRATCSCTDDGDGGGGDDAEPPQVTADAKTKKAERLWS